MTDRVGATSKVFRRMTQFLQGKIDTADDRTKTALQEVRSLGRSSLDSPVTVQCLIVNDEMGLSFMLAADTL